MGFGEGVEVRRRPRGWFVRLGGELEINLDLERVAGGLVANQNLVQG
jgi:hypothetical protein